MSTRTVADVEADIASVKMNNPNWLTDAADKALIAAFTNEKIALLHRQAAPVVSQAISRLLGFFRSNSPPANYGKAYKLPDGLQFLFTSLSSIMIVRMCYERVQSIIRKKLTATNRGSGLIFSGGQGNSKTWLSLYIVWTMVYEGMTVIYEICEEGVVYVISPDGSIRVIAIPASHANVPELREVGAVHIYDAKAKSWMEPASSPAFLIEFSSRNSENYAQTSRRYGVDRYCIPSYEVDELLLYCDLFQVSAEVVRQRCAVIGPSMRYILVNNFADCQAHTEAVARKVKAEQMDDYISNTLFGDDNDISACLVLAIVNEQDHPDPDDAYKEVNTKWELASSHLAKIIVNNASSDATNFVRKLVTEVNSKGLSKMKGLVGNYLEVVVHNFIIQGKFLQCRRLVEPGQDEALFRRMILWQQPLRIEEPNIHDLRKALSECTKMDTLYCFCKTFPAIDFAAHGFSVVFQVTNSASHSIHLESIRAICNHVHTKVFLIFVVPEDTISGANWRYSQSFSYYEAESTEGGPVRVAKKQRKFHALPENIRAELKNLEQYVLCYK